MTAAVSHHSVDAWVANNHKLLAAVAGRHASVRTLHSVLTRFALEADRDGIVQLPDDLAEWFPGWRIPTVKVNITVLKRANVLVPLDTNNPSRWLRRGYRIDLFATEPQQPQLPLKAATLPDHSVAELATAVEYLTLWHNSLTNDFSVVIDTLKALLFHLEEMTK